jgi:hypothetical protein
MEVLGADACCDRIRSFDRLRRTLASRHGVVHVQDLGDYEQVLKNRALLGKDARALLKGGIIPNGDGWGGWLGKYQAALA